MTECLLNYEEKIIMEEYILADYYRKFLEQEKPYNDMKKCLRIILFCIIVLSAAGSFYILFFVNNNHILLVSVLVEVIATIILSKIDYKEEKLYQKSKKIIQMDNHYDEVKRWLFDLRYRDKSQVKQLCCRCEAIAEKNKESYNEVKGTIDKAAAIFLAPALLYALEHEFEVKKSIWLHFQEFCTFFILFALSYLIMYMCLKVYYNNIKNASLKKLIQDLHGVLDRTFIDEKN